MSQQINLFNPVFLKKQTLFSAVAMAQGLGLVCAGLVGLGLLSANRVSHVRVEADIVAARLKAAQTQLTQMVERTRPAQTDKATEDAIKLASERLRVNQQVLNFVSKEDLGNTHGYSEFFRALSRRAMQGVWLTGITLEGGGSGMVIRGRALEPTMIPSYLATLKQEPLFKGRSFGSLELRTPSPQTMAKNAMPVKAVFEQPYIEFVLKSSDAVDDRTEHAEAREK